MSSILRRFGIERPHLCDFEHFDPQCVETIERACEAVGLCGANPSSIHLLHAFMEPRSDMLCRTGFEDLGIRLGEVEDRIHDYRMRKIYHDVEVPLGEILNRALREPSGTEGRDIFSLARTLLKCTDFIASFKLNTTHPSRGDPISPECVLYYFERIRMWNRVIHSHLRSRNSS